MSTSASSPSVAVAADAVAAALASRPRRERPPLAPAVTPRFVRDYADRDSRALSEVEADDLLRELAYRAGAEMGGLTVADYEAALRRVLEMSPLERFKYAAFTSGRVLVPG